MRPILNKATCPLPGCQRDRPTAPAVSADPLLLSAILLAAALYSSVGHGGASAYIAILALAGMARPAIAPTVLLMNLVVSALAFWRYRGGGHLDTRLAIAIVIFSAPAAFAGGLAPLPPRAFILLLGFALVVAGARLLLPRPLADEPARPAGRRLWGTAAPIGAGLGLLAGLTGVGGGIYLSPLILFLGWVDAKGMAAVSALFIFVNSAAGLGGRLLRGQAIEPSLLPLVGVALAGGLIGSWWGASRAGDRGVRRLLGVVLLVAAAKLLFTP